MLNLNELERAPKRKRNIRSFLSEAVTNIDTHISSKCVPPPAKKISCEWSKNFMFDDCSRHHFLWVLMRSYSIPSSIPSWTGFYIEMSDNIPIMSTSMQHLKSINSPATEMSTVCKVCFSYLKCHLGIFKYLCHYKMFNFSLLLTFPHIFFLKNVVLEVSSQIIDF